MITSCLETSECRLAVSAMVVGGVESTMDDAIFDEASASIWAAKKLLSGERDDIARN